MREVSGRSLQKELAPTFHQELERALTSPGVKLDLANPVLLDAVKARASDIHLEPQKELVQVRFRVDGEIWDVAAVSRGYGKVLLNQLKAHANIDPIANFTPRDAHAAISHEGRSIDLRLALSPCQFGETLNIRVLDARRLERNIDNLGLTKESLARLHDWIENTNGMFLACGPTGSGKTTTIYSLLHELKFSNRAIISLEDPVEYEIEGITQVQLDPRHHLNFAEGIRGMLRLDPDYLMLGEIRDAASAHASVNAAISGRVLLSTIHSRDAVGALTALRNWGLRNHEIGESLAVIVAQRLVRKLCPDCRAKEAVSAVEKRWLELFHLPEMTENWVPKGCKRCANLGYSGRTGIFEFWKLDESDYKLILENADEHAIRDNLAAREHRFIYLDGYQKVKEGVTSLTELKKVSAGCTPCKVLEFAEGTRTPETEAHYSNEPALSVV